MKKLFTNSFLKVFIAPLVVLAFFLPNLFIGKIPIPADSLLGLYHPWRDNSYSNFAPNKFPVKNPLITDSIRQTYPWRQIVVNNLRNSSLPLWNPYIFSGQPLLANLQSATYQALNVFYILLPFKIGWTLQIILPLMLTSSFMYLFLKNRGLADMSSLLGAIVLPFSGFFMVWQTWGTIIPVAMWLPLILFCIDKLQKKPSALHFLILTFSLFQTTVSGHAQTSVYVIFAAMVYTVWQTFTIRKIRSSVLVFLAIIFAFLISAPQLLPTIEFSSLSNRSIDQSFWQGRDDWFLPVQHLIQLVVPDFFGNPTTNNYWGVWNYAEFVSYIGIVPLLFATLAILRPSKNYSFFAFIAFLSAFLALENPISKIPYVTGIPFISSFQPSRIIFLICFSLTCLAAYGIDLYLKGQINKKSILVTFCSFLCLFAFLSLASKIFANNFPSVNNVSSASIALRNMAIPAALLVLLSSIFLLRSKIPKHTICIWHRNSFRI